MPAMPLRQLQQRFRDLVHSSDPGALQELGRAVGIADKPPIPIAQRADIYRRAYRLRIEESLEDDFAEVRERLGHEAFARLVGEFLDSRPSRFASLAEVSGLFPAFVARSGLDPEPARLEWEKILSSLAPDPEPCDFALLAALAPEAQLKVTLRLAPSVRLFESVGAIPRAVISSRNGEPSVTELAPEPFELIRRISQGKTIGELATGISGLTGEQVMQWFSSWVASGWIAGFSK